MANHSLNILLEEQTYQYINVHNLIEIAGDEPDFILEIIQDYRTHSENIFEQMYTAVSQNNSESVMRAAHSLKGSLLFITHAPLKNLLQQLEDQARSQASGVLLMTLIRQAGELFNTVQTELTALQQLLENYK